MKELFAAFQQFKTWVYTNYGDSPQNFIKGAGDAFKDLNNAKTTEDKQAAAKKIQDLISKL